MTGPSEAVIKEGRWGIEVAVEDEVWQAGWGDMRGAVNRRWNRLDFPLQEYEGEMRLYPTEEVLLAGGFYTEPGLGGKLVAD